MQVRRSQDMADRCFFQALFLHDNQILNWGDLDGYGV